VTYYSKVSASINAAANEVRKRQKEEGRRKKEEGRKSEKKINPKYNLADYS
jgi:hypothetical protein